MAITITPNTPQNAVVGTPICFNASAVIVIVQEDLRAIDLPSSGTNWTYDVAFARYKKVSGSTADDARAIVSNTIHNLQPFYIQGANSTFTTPGSPNNNSHCYVGVLTEDDRLYAFEFLKYCNSNTTTCNATTGSNWLANARVNTIVAFTRNVNFNENFRVRSDGITLYYEHQTGGIWTLDYSIVLPVAETFRFIVGGIYVQNEVSFTYTFKGSYQGGVPTIWSAPLGGTLDGTGDSRCFTAVSTGSYQVCVESEFDDPVCVDVEVDDLYFEPDGDLLCGDCVFGGTVVHFTSNGGSLGTLTAVDPFDNPVGTVIDSLTWQAPTSPVTATLTYTIDEADATCELQVVEPFQILNVDGVEIRGLVPGDTFQLLSNYQSLDDPLLEDFNEVVWENIDCPNLVSPTGLLTIPRESASGCFGAIDCRIRARLVNIITFGCANLAASPEGTIELRVVVDPIYPTPEYGGPQPNKWKPEVPEFREIINEYEGGCDETYLRNRVPEYRWTVSYSGIPYELQDCGVCDDAIGTPNGVSLLTQVAKRIDDFWLYVYGKAGRFTLKDFRTGEIWKNVRFEEKIERDHINWLHTQSRTVKLVWKPCCETSPAGGTCEHNTVITDNFAPTVPTNLAALADGAYTIMVSWDPSADEIGVAGYELEVDGVIVNVGNVLAYRHTGLAQSSEHDYRIRAYDFGGNRSAWSSIVSETTDFADDESPTVPDNLTAVEDGYTEITVSWDAATDNIEVTGYELIADGYLIDVGDVLTYQHTGLAPSSEHMYYIRAYDAAGNRSSWSDSVVASTLTDLILPEVEITTPLDGWVISGDYTFEAEASDDVIVNRVEWYWFDGIGFAHIGDSFTDPYTLEIDTTDYENGEHVFSATAFDAAGNASTPDFVTVTVGNGDPDLTPPTVPDCLSIESTVTDSILITWCESYDEGPYGPDDDEDYFFGA